MGVRPYLPGLRAKCCLYMITHSGDHTDLAVGPKLLRLAGTACPHVCVRPCLMVRPGPRARCCLYMITHSGDHTDLAVGPEWLRLAGTACPRVCKTLSQGQTWPQSQVLSIHNHTELAVGPEWLRLARYCMVDV
jgi:hypothetical protein